MMETPRTIFTFRGDAPVEVFEVVSPAGPTSQAVHVLGFFGPWCLPEMFEVEKMHDLGDFLKGGAIASVLLGLA